MSLLNSSIRLRLLVLILVPLLAVSSLAILWRFNAAKSTAEDIFDRNLTMMTLAISRDVSLSGGDSLSETTGNLFRGVSGGTVYYHVNGPDGSFITGYSSPPIRDEAKNLPENSPIAFDAHHLGEPVRVVQLAERTEVDGISGVSTVTVWQRLEQRNKFAQDLAVRAASLALLLILTVAGLVLFGIRLGLKPLSELENAIQKRSSDDLSPIVRQVPVETKGIVSRLNNLFAKVSDAQASRERLISNAAHQLRNPVAGIHTMAQATLKAKTLSEARAQESLSRKPDVQPD